MYALFVSLALAANGGPAYTFTEIELEGPAAAASNGFSGLAWYSDTLLMLPERPSPNGHLYTATRGDIRRAMDEGVALEPQRMPLLFPNRDDVFPDFDGYEGIAVYDDTVWLAIERKSGRTMAASVVRGTISFEDGVQVGRTVHAIPLQQSLPQLSVESVVAVPTDSVLAIAECNHEQYHGFAAWRVFPREPSALESPIREVPAAAPQCCIPYRLTDATRMQDGSNAFFAINYWWTGEPALAVDDEERARGKPVHRLLRFTALDDHSVLHFDLNDHYPLPGSKAEQHNWEGVASWDDIAFVIITDTHPRTVFGVVSYPKP